MQQRANGLSLLDVAVVLVVAGILASLLLPSLRKVRSPSGRTRCASNLRQIGVAAIAYMTSPFGPGDRKGFMPHIRRIDEADGDGDVGLVFQLLVNVGEIDDTEVFVCPSSVDIPERIPLDVRLEDFAFRRSTDVTVEEVPFSYGWAVRQRTDGNSGVTTIISADRTVTGPSSRIGNHPDGRNLLRFDGSVDFNPRDVEVGPLADPHIVLQLENDLNLYKHPSELP